MGEVSQERQKQISEQVNGDAKKVADAYKNASKDGAVEANKILQDEVNRFDKQSGQSPAERKLYIQSLTKKLEEGENPLLPKISEAWLIDPASKLSTDAGVTKAAVTKRLEDDKLMQSDETKPNSDSALLESKMLESIQNKYFAPGTTNDFVSASTIKGDLSSDELKRAESNKALCKDTATPTSKDQDWDAANALLANNGKLFNTVDAMGGSSVDGYISYADLVKFCDLARKPQSEPNAVNTAGFSDAEIKAVETLKDRFSVNPLGSAGARGIESYSFVTNQNYITRDSLAAGLEQNKDTLVKTLGAKKYPDESTAVRPGGDYDAAKALLMNNGRLFNTVDAMGGSTADGYISQNDLVKFCDLARKPKTEPNAINSNFSEDEIKAMEALRDRFNSYPLGSSGARKIESYSFLMNQNYITRDSLAAGLGQDKDTMVKTFGDIKSLDAKPANETPKVDSTPKTDDPKKVEDPKKVDDTKKVEDPKKADANPPNPNLKLDPQRNEQEQVKSAKYDDGVVREYTYTNGMLSKVVQHDGDKTTELTVTPAGTIQDGDKKYTEAKVDQKTGEFKYKDQSGKTRDFAVEPVNPNLSFNKENPAQLDKVTYPNGATVTFEYEKGKPENLTKFTSTDSNGIHEYTVKPDGVYEGGNKTAMTEPKLDQKTGAFTYKLNGKDEKREVAPQFSDLDSAKRNELSKNVTEKLHVGRGQGYWQVAEQVLQLHGKTKPSVADVRALTEILKKANRTEGTDKARTVLTSKDILLDTNSKEFKELLNRMAS